MTPTWYLLITHPEWVPDWLSFILIEGEVHLPIVVQLFIVELALDGLKLASMNTPSSLNNTFGVVGGLILGDFAVQIGWFVPEVIVYMAFVGGTNSSQSSYELGYAFKFLRMMMLLLTALFGLPGYICGARPDLRPRRDAENDQREEELPLPADPVQREGNEASRRPRAPENPRRVTLIHRLWIESHFISVVSFIAVVQISKKVFPRLIMSSSPASL